MEKKIPYFGFNSSKTRYEYFNVTQTHIIEDIKKNIPSLSMPAIQYLLDSRANYVPPIKPQDVKKKRVRKTTTKKVKENLITLPTTNGNKYVKLYKELFDLGNSFYSYHKNGYRQWGVVVNEIFDDGAVQKSYATFEEAFESAFKVLANEDLEMIVDSVLTLCVSLLDLKEVMGHNHTFHDSHYDGMEFLYGNHRRLGMKTLVERVEGVVDRTLSS